MSQVQASALQNSVSLTGQIPISNWPVHFNVDLWGMHRIYSGILLSITAAEGVVASLVMSPAAAVVALFEMGPIIQDLNDLANSCLNTMLNYESCEAQLVPLVKFDFAKVVPMLATGVETALGSALGVGETAVAAPRVASLNTTGAQNLPAMLDRLRQAQDSGQVIIDNQVDAAGNQKFVAYLPGTQTWSPVPRGNAFDLTSDVAALANNGTAAAERSVRTALAESGYINVPQSHLTLVGFSEGAIVAANLAASGDLPGLKGIVSVGGPIDAIKIPDSVRVISLQHTNDIVPMVDLAPAPHRNHWTTLKLPAAPGWGHSLDSYQKSLAQVSAGRIHSAESQVQAGFTNGLVSEQRYLPQRVAKTQ